MYAIVEISGKQYKVEQDMVLFVNKLDQNPNDEFVIDKVLLFANGTTVQVGQPYLSSVKITSTVMGDIQDKKVRGIKFKKRKNYTRTLGHRQTYTKLKINQIKA